MERDARCPVHPEAKLSPAVRGASDQFFGLGTGFDYSKCAECSALVLLPRPSPSEIGPYYSEYYTDRMLKYFRERAERGRRVGGAGRLRAFGYLRALEKLGVPTQKTTRLLDVGCGLGSFARYVRDFSGITVRGVDFSEECVRFAREVQKVEVDRGELSAQKYDDESFDLVTSWHYMEHVYDPQADLREMARVLKPGGLLMAETPTTDVLASLFGKRWLYLMPPTHLYHYKPQTMCALMEGAGLEVVKVARPWFPGELAGSIMLSFGVTGFVAKVFGPERPFSQKLLTAWLLAQMIYDIPVTVMLALMKRSGLLRVYARKPG